MQSVWHIVDPYTASSSPSRSIALVSPSLHVLQSFGVAFNAFHGLHSRPLHFLNSYFQSQPPCILLCPSQRPISSLQSFPFSISPFHVLCPYFFLLQNMHLQLYFSDSTISFPLEFQTTCFVTHISLCCVQETAGACMSAKITIPIQLLPAPPLLSFYKDIAFPRFVL